MLVLPLCGCSIAGGDASAQKPRRPYAVLVVFDEFPGDTQHKGTVPSSSGYPKEFVVDYVRGYRPPA